MDFPVFHLDFMSNPMLIAVIAVTHVFINHPLAVGAIPLIALMEWWGHRNRDQAWDDLARRILMVCFIITTTVGALTGVGIWFSAALVNPSAIGHLIRVFFPAWFVEWIIFVIEVGSIMVYALTWKTMANRKGRHIAMGWALALASWLTMVIIVAILAFMMDPGSWNTGRSWVTGVFNPIYFPQLAFRTPLAMVTAGLFGMFLLFFFTRNNPELRRRATRFLALWVMAWLPLLAAGSFWYRSVIPSWMNDNIQVAITTLPFVSWYQTLSRLLVVMLAAIFLISAWALFLPRRIPRAALLVPFVLALVLMGYFERVREFIRKPYTLGSFLYANGIRESDYPLYQQEGLLRHATYVQHREITEENKLEAGRDVFLLACTRCHTTGGFNGVVRNLERMYGPEPWDRETVKAFFQGMHISRPYMPPFPGTDKEAGALADYLLAQQQYPRSLDGMQSTGIRLTSEPTGLPPRPIDYQRSPDPGNRPPGNGDRPPAPGAASQEGGAGADSLNTAVSLNLSKGGN